VECLSLFPHYKMARNLTTSGQSFFVEMGGLEPPSKHCTKQLSTCLSVLWFSTKASRIAGEPWLIL
jgi:hypothetical protein